MLYDVICISWISCISCISHNFWRSYSWIVCWLVHPYSPWESSRACRAPVPPGGSRYGSREERWANPAWDVFFFRLFQKGYGSCSSENPMVGKWWSYSWHVLLNGHHLPNWYSNVFLGHVPRFYFWTDPLWSVESLRNSWGFALLSTLQAGETWAGVMEPSPQKVQRLGLEEHVLVGGLEHFLFSPIVGMMIQSDSYVSGGLKPPTRLLLVVAMGPCLLHHIGDSTINNLDHSGRDFSQR